jgi:predicted 3-demethylubiquinone-9 3-methyltransferase (glyoxalase superfamily)
MQKITTCLWFDNEAEEAAKFYTSIFKDSQIINTVKYMTETPSDKPLGSVMLVEFDLAGRRFTGLNGGPHFKFNEAISFPIACEDQAEIDYFWEKLSAVPASEQCGWVKDKFGVSWQIIPKNMSELITTPAKMQAMLKMKKIIIAELEKA